MHSETHSARSSHSNSSTSRSRVFLGGSQNMDYPPASLQNSMSFMYENQKRMEQRQQQQQHDQSGSLDPSISSPENSGERGQEFNVRKIVDVIHQMLVKPLLVGILMGSAHLAIVSVFSHYYPKEGKTISPSARVRRLD